MIQKPLKIVNASAGSGKTYTLVQEYLRIVLHDKNPMKFRSVLAMTFTNKAANEMKERILDGLIQLSKPAPDKSAKELQFLIDTSKNLGIGPRVIESRSVQILNRILHNYGSFSVMTIDKFTHKIIRTFAKDLNLSIDFDVELDLKTLRKNVTDMLFDQIGRNKDLTALMLRYAQTNLAEDKSWNFTQQLFDFSNEIFKEEAIKSINLLKKLSSADFLTIQNDLVKENKQISATITRNAKEAIDLARSKGLSKEDFAGKSKSIIAYFERIVRGDFKPVSSTILKNIDAGNWGHPQSSNKALADEIAPLLETYFNQLQHLLTTSYKTYLINREVLKNLNNLSLLNHLLALVEQLKSEENILLISDFYQKIAAIITEEPVPFIYERLGVRYEHFLLDEFQDTSHLQWINLIPLIHNALAQHKTNLIVGDGKQAIYRWRNGEVEQFTRLPKEVYNPENIASLKDATPLFNALGEKIALTKNFRSAPEIVAFNNHIFPEITRDLPENLHSIYATANQEPTKTFSGYVESYFTKKIEQEDQLAYVEQTIHKALANNYQLKDICILTRDNTKGALISKYLTERGLKVISPESLFIGKDASVKFIIALMSAQTVPTSKNHKIKTLEHFATLILKKEVRLVIAHHAQDILDLTIPEILTKYNYHLAVPTDFHNMYEFVESLIDTFKLKIAANPFLQFLLEQVHLFEKRKSASLRDFIDWFNERGHRTSIVSPDGANAIQVMTIHKSKGLQFPIVICPFFDWKMDLNKQISWIERSNDKLPAYFLKMSSVLKETDFSTIYETEEGKFYLDQLNLLYVAFTRPEVALFMCGKVASQASPAKLWLKPYFESTQLGQYIDDKFTLGDFIKIDAQETVEAENYSIRFYGKKMEKPVLSYKSAENWDIDELDEKRLFGTKLHWILSQIKAFSAVDVALKKGINKGQIDEADSAAIKQYITHLFNDQHFANYFKGDKQLNEKVLLDKNGKKLIPDKIIIGKNDTLIVDFKTGQKTPNHALQIAEYMTVLSDIGFKGLRGELYYTENREVVPILI